MRCRVSGAIIIMANILTADAEGVLVNDVHSQLNPTRVARIAAPRTLAELQEAVRQARANGWGVSVAGGRHAMGGQQFAADAVLIDMSRLNRVLHFAPERGLIEVEAGIEWPELIAYTVASGAGWGIAQKQTGADRLSLGGSLAANIHGRGLTMKPIIDDVEAFVIVDANGDALRCSRSENAELFRLAIGGYGLFGVIFSVTLRLVPRRQVKRVARLANSENLAELFAERIADGFLYGDFQFAIAPESDDFLRRGIFSCYQPAPPSTPLAGASRELSADDWRALLALAHTDKQKAFDGYTSHYLATDGQIYWSDTHQLSVYLDDYHAALDRQMDAPTRRSEMISELYVPRAALSAFLEAARADFRQYRVPLIYGTVRLIERDAESFLAWAREDFACVVLNLCVAHDAAGLARAAADFRRLIDRALSFGGSYYLTYHRWAAREQLLAAYPQFPEFLRLKRQYDPTGLWQSDWYRHQSALCKP